MPARTGVGSKRKKRKERRRLCLELSKCGSSGPQSLYQCHSSVFFLPSICPATVLPLSEQEKHSLSHHGWLNTITNPPFFSTTYPAHAISSLNIALCLNAILFFFFHSFQSLDPIMFVEVQSTEKLPHFTSSAHAISICSLNIRVGCKCHSLSGYLDDLL